MKTIKELTELTGVSKVSIYNLINKKNLKQYTFKKSGITYIDEIGVNFIISYYSSEQQQTLDNIIQESKENTDCKDSKFDINSDMNTIQILNNQLEETVNIIKIFERQLEQKDKQINCLTEIMATETRIKENSQKITFLTDNNLVQANAPYSNERKSFFNWVFRKKIKTHN